MAVIDRMGWEFNSGVEWYDTTNGTAPVTQATTVRSGGFALKCSGTAANASWLHNGGTAAAIPTLVATTKYFYRLFFQVSALPTNTTRIMSFRTTAATDTGMSIRLTSAGKLQVGSVVTGVFTQVGSDSAAAVSTNTWFMVDLGRAIGTGALDYVEGRLNGVSIASTTTANITDTAGALMTVGWEAAPGNTTDLFADDMGLNDDTASGTWCGDEKVVLLRPISDNARVGWLDGGGATTGLSACVDNQPPIGVAAAATGTQVKNANNNTTDTYDANLTSYTTAGLGASDTINSLVLIANHGRTTNTGLAHGFRLTSNPVVSEFTSTAPAGGVATYPSSWKWVTGGATATPSVTLGTSPVMRIRKSNAGSPGANNSYVDAMGVYVGYTPGVAAGVPDVAMARVRT